MWPRVIATAVVLSFVFLAATPAGFGQAEVDVQNGQGSTVITLRIPLDAAGGPEQEQIRHAVAEGLLIVDLERITLPGPGGEVDVDAYLATAKLLIDGLEIPLPSLTILPEHASPSGEVDAAMLELAAELEELQAALESLSEDTAAEGAWAHQEVLAALAEVEWIQSMSDEATGEASAGLEAQLAIVNAMLARILTALPLLEALIDGVQSTLDHVTPEVPAHVYAKAAFAHQKVNESIAKAEAARDEYVAKVGELLAKVDERVDEQAALDGALAAARGAYEAIVAEADVVQSELGESQSEAERERSEVEARAQGAADGAQARLEELRSLVNRQAEREAIQGAAERARQSVDEVIAPIRWSIDWADAAKVWTEGATKDSITDAQSSLEAALASAHAIHAIAEKYSADEVEPAAAEQLADAGAELASAAARLDAAIADLEQARASLPSQLPGGLDPTGSPPSVPEPGISMCFQQPTAILCADYAHPAAPDKKELVLIVVVPSVAGIVPGLPVLPSPSLPSASLPSPTLGVDPTLSLPGSEPQPSPSTSSASPTVTITTTSSTSAPAAPKLGMSATPSSVSLDEGQQGAVLVTIKNTGSAADTVHLAVQASAPVSVDGSDGSKVIEAGKEGVFNLRITPLESGSGTLSLVATGEQAGTIRQDIDVMVHDVAASASNIAASIEPTFLSTEVGRESIVTVSLLNKGNIEEILSLAPSASGAEIFPASFEVALAPGESQTREFKVTPKQEGESHMAMHIHSERGADLEPIMMIGAESARAQSADDRPADPVPSDGGRSPNLAVPIIVVALALTIVAARRRMK